MRAVISIRHFWRRHVAWRDRFCSQPLRSRPRSTRSCRPHIVGLSELGLIAGTGIIIALATTLTLLPALLTVLKPSARAQADRLCRAGAAGPFSGKAAQLDRRRRRWLLRFLVCRCLQALRFDFNPLNLRAQDAESVSTLLDLMNDPDTSPNTIEVLKSNLAQASAIAEKLRQLPEVGRVLTLQSFVPEDQDAKLALDRGRKLFSAEYPQPRPDRPRTDAGRDQGSDRQAWSMSCLTRRVTSTVLPRCRRAASQGCWRHW